MSSKLSRRELISNTLFSAALGSVPLILPSKIFGENAPSKCANVAIIGCGSRSGGVTKRLTGFNNVKVLATVDPFMSRAVDFANHFNQAYGSPVCKAYQDFREIMERKDIDGVFIITPDHWHVPIALCAARAGKAMYVEKPLSLTINWAKKLREECKGKNIIFQYGTQQRSARDARLAVDLVRNGYIGDLTKIDVWSPSLGVTNSQKATLNSPVPNDLNYDLFQGPSELKPYSPERVSTLGSWHCSDHALGFIAGWGAHPLDIMQWGLNTDHTGPVKIEGTGVMPREGDVFDTVREWDIHFSYSNGVPIRFMSQKTAKDIVMAYHRSYVNNGTTFHGTEGWVNYSRGTCYLFRKGKYENAGKFEFKKEDSHAYVSDDHTLNFIEGIIQGKPTISGLESAIRSDTISHLSDMVIRSGKSLAWNPEKELIVNGTPQQVALMDREVRAPYTL